MDILNSLKHEYKEILKRYDFLLQLEVNGKGDKWIIEYVKDEKRINFAKEDVIDNILKSLNIDPIDFHTDCRKELRDENEAH